MAIIIVIFKDSSSSQKTNYVRATPANLPNEAGNVFN